MKTSKIVGITALAAAIMLSLAFAGCNLDLEYTYTFENMTTYDITVTFVNAEYGSLFLKGMTPGTELTATPEKKSLTVTSQSKYGWSAAGLTTDLRDKNIEAVPNGNGLIFKKNESQALANRIPNNTETDQE
ncbi:MAG: hypothetical protein LBG95_03655 [Treponema sp.]|jgi:hypothetical protein|nr:hypothetical protein [Treponema sp.]